MNPRTVADAIAAGAKALREPGRTLDDWHAGLILVDLADAAQNACREQEKKK